MRLVRPLLALAAVTFLAVLVFRTGGSGQPAPLPAVALRQVADGLTDPVHLTHAGDRSDRLFIVEQAGRIRILKDGRLLPRPFLDIQEKVTSGGELGLLSAAFHPRYPENGRFFVNYTTGEGERLRSVIAEYRVSADVDVAAGGEGRLPRALH